MPPVRQAQLSMMEGGQAIGSVRLDTLRSIVFVPAFSIADEASPAPDQHGYQRDPEPRRFKAIGEYYAGGGLLTPIILSARIPAEDAADFIRFIQNGETEAIGERWGSQCLAVLDGQHRLGGLTAASEGNPSFNPLVPVLINFGLSYAAETQEFDTINTRAKSLPKSLVEVSKADITEPEADTYERKIRSYAVWLARNEESPWAGRVNIAGLPGGGRRTNLETLRRAVAATFTREILMRVEAAEHSPTELLGAYWSAIARHCEPAWNNVGMDKDTAQAITYKLHSAVGIGALARLGRDIMTTALESDAVFDSIEESVSRLSSFDWSSGNLAGLAGFAGAQVLYERLYGLVFVPQLQRRRRAS